MDLQQTPMLAARIFADGDVSLRKGERAIAVAPTCVPCSASPTGWMRLAHKAGLAANFGVSSLAVRELAAASQAFANEGDDPLVVVLSNAGLALFRRGVRSQRILPQAPPAKRHGLEADRLVAWLRSEVCRHDGGQIGLYLRLHAGPQSGVAERLGKAPSKLRR